MKKIIFLVFATFLMYHNSDAQVLYYESFDNLTPGNITNDPSGGTPGQGNWYVNLTSPVTAKIVPEPSKGNILGIENFSVFHGKQKNLQNVWNNRTTGNNILLAEYDFYSEEIENNTRFYLRAADNKVLIDMILATEYNTTLKVKEAVLSALFPASGTSTLFEQKNFKYTKSWLTIRIYIDYNTYNLYIHIPKLNILHAVTLQPILPIDQIDFLSNLNNTFSGIYIKYDNVRLTALKSVPPEVLSTNTFLSEKFNLFPNPATTIVNITNNEQMKVKEVEIYDTAGKLIDTQTFNDKTEIQLNVSALNSGTYLLHIQTNEGIAVKKLVKN